MAMRQKLFEWLMALALIGIGTLVAINPVVLSEGAMRHNLFSAIGRTGLACLLISVGVTRVIGLYHCGNGAWPTWGPRLRALATGFGALFWFQGMVGLVGSAFERDKLPGIEIVVCFILMLGEFVSCLFAAEDVRSREKSATVVPWRWKGFPN